MKRLIKKASTIQLMHGTSDIFLDDIKENGLKPANISNQSATSQSSISNNGSEYPDSVYLTEIDEHADFYADRAQTEFGGKGIVLYVTINEDLLEADEDIYEVLYAEPDGSYTFVHDENITFPPNHEFTGKDSLDLIGAARYVGIIPPTQITNINNL